MWLKFSAGLHNFEQLLFSLILSLWIACYLFFEWHMIISSHVHFILSQSENNRSNEVLVEEQNKHFLEVIKMAKTCCFVAIAVMLGLQVSFFLLCNYKTIPHEWLELIIDKCNQNNATAEFT